MKSEEEQRWWDFPAAVLLVAALLTAATRLLITEWTDHLGIATNLTLIGVIAGLALGQSRFSGRVSAFFAVCYGAFFITWRLGSTIEGNLLWSDRLIVLSTRLTTIVGQLMRREIVQDSLLFLVMMAVLFWVLSIHAGYTLSRHGMAWPAILPAGLTLFVIHSFDAILSRRALYLVIFLFFSLVLVARTSFLQQHKRWEQSRTALPPHLGLDFIRFTLAAVALLVVFAWTAPALAEALPVAEEAWQPVRQAWLRTRDRMDDAFASLRSTVGVVSDYYGSSMMLGRGNLLTDIEMFRVKPPEDAPDSLRYYWRARVYDYYINGGWRNSLTVEEPFDPEQIGLQIPLAAGRFTGTFEIVPSNHVSTIFAPAQPEWVSRKGRVEYIGNPDGTVDVVMFRASPVIRAGGVYEVRSAVSNVTVAQLRTAGEEYPQWIKDRYLQLPSDVTDRTRRLAEEITRDLETPYDKAAAVTEFLRKNIAYTQTVPEVPPDREVLDWFLFDLQQGFCNYYASAEVILLRSVGIPARWATGYAQGERLDNGWYVVRQEEAHAWPEVYFPGLGWVEFEPTASQPAVVYPAGSSTDSLERAFGEEYSREQRLQDLLEAEENRAALEGDLPGLTNPAGERWAALRTVIASTTGILILLSLTWHSIRTRFNLPALPVLLGNVFEKAGIRPPRLLTRFSTVRRDRRWLNLPPLAVIIESAFIRMGIHPPGFITRWASQASLPPLARSYHEINHALVRLGQSPAYADTPAERADSLEAIIPPATPSIRLLVGEYQRATFSPLPADISSAESAADEIRGLSSRERLRRVVQELLSRVQKPVNTPRRPWQKQR